MSFADVVNQHWDQIHVLSQLCVIIGQSSLERPLANVEHDFIGTDEEMDDAESCDYNLELMYKIGDRVLEMASDFDDVSDIHCVFYWTSQQEHVNVSKMEEWSDQIIALCDTLSSKPWMNLIELDESIQIETYRHLTFRHLAYVLNDDDKALHCILRSIHLASKNNYFIKLFNAMFEERTSEIQQTQDAHQTEIDRMIVNGEMEIRELNDIVSCYHFAANLCQKMNDFEQSLDLIQKAINITKNELNLELKDRAVTMIPEPVTSDEEEEEEEATHTQMDIDYDPTYEMKIELSSDIQRMIVIKDKSWKDMDKGERLFYFVHREIFDMILTRGLAYSNLNEYLLAFHDSYLCTLTRPSDITAWNNRAFAWYQLQQYHNCIIDCNFALQCLPQAKQSLFTRGLVIGNRGLSEYKLKQYHKAINDLNVCLKHSPQSRLAREALRAIWKEFTNAIYQGCTQIDSGNANTSIDIPFAIAKIIADYGVGIDFDIIPQCHDSTIVYQS
eukprot:571116_1